MEWVYPSTATMPPTVVYSAVGVPSAQPNPVDAIGLRSTRIPPAVSTPVSAALLGAVIGGANAFGRNLYRVQQGEMTISQAMVRGLMHGAATSVATTTAAVLTANVTDSDALHLAALAATTAGLSYLITAGARTAIKRKSET
jgi:hypothetical protein